MIIEDGTGGGFSTKVDINNRLSTTSISTNEFQYKSIIGDGYTIGTSQNIYLTGITESSVLFVRNNNSEDLVFNKIFVLISGTTDITAISIIRNPNNITPNTGATGGAMTNNNFGEFKVPNITIIDGSDGATFENGDVWIYYHSVTPYFSSTDTFVLPKGASFGVSVTPPSNNTGININVGFSFYTKTI